MCLVKRFNHFVSWVIPPLLLFNIILAIHFLLPGLETDQKIVSTSQVYERAKHGRKYYSCDKITFERVAILVERGSNASIKGATKGQVGTTFILNLPQSCRVLMGSQEIKMNHILGIQDTSGFIIPLVTGLGYVFLV